MTTSVIKLKISENVESQSSPRILVQEADGSVGYVAKDSIGGSGIGGTQYSYVAGKGTPTENATELQTAYNLAKTIVGLSATNRYKILVGTGKYEFTGQFPVNTQFIDFVSLTGDADVEFTNGINVTANNVYLKGLKTSLAFQIATNLNLLVCEKCIGGNGSFGGAYNTSSGTFTDCTGGNNSFGGDFGTSSGTFTNCTGAYSCFGGVYGISSGTYTNCKGIDFAFAGSSNSISSGTYTNCIGGDSSFGGGGTASGTFTNCIGGDSSFGGGITAFLTGKLFYCRLTSGEFKTVSSGGRTYYCVNGAGNPNNQ